MHDDRLAAITWLVSQTGLQLLDDTVAALDAGADELTVATRLRRDPRLAEATRPDGASASTDTTELDDAAGRTRAALALSAAIARRRARDQWPRADQLVALPEALEQASDPLVAAWRAKRFANRNVFDLCAGIGGDSIALAATARRVTAVDHDPVRLRLLRHNVSIHDRTVDAIVADALAVDVPADATIHADPSRRRAGRRLRRLADHDPPVDALLERYRHTEGVGIVLSPGVDLADPVLPDDAELEFIQVGNDLREAILWTGQLRQPGVDATATLLPHGVSISRGERGAHQPVGPVEGWLVEPAPAAVRARVHDQVMAEIGALRVARRRALFSTPTQPRSSHWWTARRIEAVLPARPKAVRRWLHDADARPVELVLHGVEGDPERWWRNLGRPARGPQGRRIELVRLDEGSIAVITEATATADSAPDPPRTAP